MNVSIVKGKSKKGSTKGINFHELDVIQALLKYLKINDYLLNRSDKYIVMWTILVEIIFSVSVY